MTVSSKSRRQFLRNTTLATLSAGLIPQVLKAEQNTAEAVTTDCFPTTLDYYGQGPFYTPGAPSLVNNKLATDSEPGQRLIISGVVRTLDCTQYIADTVIDIWQANDAGQYDNSGFNLRGKTMTNAQGFYTFETILPGKYLNGAQYRPRHIHFKISPTGFPTLTTQLYFAGVTSIPDDAAASITSGQYDATHRIVTLTTNADGKLEGTWDIVVDGDGTGAGLHDIYLDKGMIYAVFPNPSSDTMQIQYGVFQKSKVSLSVYDMKGALVAVLDEQDLTPQKYTAEWKTPADMPAGIYWVALKINDLQVHYQKVVRN